MEREIDLKEISDGRLYTAGDMVKAGCNDCKGCFRCCQGMGNSIILDLYDIFQLECCLHMDFSSLIEEEKGPVELNVVEGIICPNLKMNPQKDACGFLSQEGRCLIHEYRPGFCRMFPLGRIYEEEGFHYFLQIHECPYPGKTKVKLKKWLGIPNLSLYEQFIKDWHFFLKEIKEVLKDTENEEIAKKLNLYILNLFYVKQYDTDTDFYSQFYGRLEEGKKAAALYR